MVDGGRRTKGWEEGEKDSQFLAIYALLPSLPFELSSDDSDSGCPGLQMGARRAQKR